MLLSILIPTLGRREALCAALERDLASQISACGASGQVEVLTVRDDGAASVGAKRNELVRRASGDYSVFVDDDDEVSDRYVGEIVGRLKVTPPVDAIGFRGMISSPGRAPLPVVYSRSCEREYSYDGVFYRWPCHLTPMRTSIFRAHPFSEVSRGEDSDFSRRVRLSKAVGSESFIDRVMYHYRYDPKGSATQAPVVLSTPGRTPPTFSVIVPSARLSNLKRCVDSILDNDRIPSSSVIVVNDGALAVGESYRGVRVVQGVKPFCYARNVNLGISACPGDVILMNDDAVLSTRFGFSSLSQSMSQNPYAGVCSAAISGYVGNPAQKPSSVTALMRGVGSTLAFVCVYIPRKVISKVGMLDERFTGYGFEDNDYCTRVSKAGLVLGVYDGCVVHHSEDKRDSTFRSDPGVSKRFSQNQALYQQKWNQKAKV